MSDINSTRKSQIGTGVGLRNEKIRTYNYSQCRIMDHRLEGRSGTVHNFDEFMKGGYVLDDLIEKLRTHGEIQQLSEIIKDY